MREVTMQKYKAAKEAVANGATVTEAIKEQKMSTNSYFKMQKLEKKTAKKATTVIRRPKFIDLPQPAPQIRRVFVVVCDPSEIKNVIGELA